MPSMRPKRPGGGGDDNLGHHGGHALDRRWIPVVMAEGLQEGRRDRAHLPYLRGRAITMLAIAGATVPEIASISGLSLGDVR
jgi:hypothetical protein